MKKFPLNFDSKCNYFFKGNTFTTYGGKPESFKTPRFLPQAVQFVYAGYSVSTVYVLHFALKKEALCIWNSCRAYNCTVLLLLNATLHILNCVIFSELFRGKKSEILFCLYQETWKLPLPRQWDSSVFRVIFMFLISRKESYQNWIFSSLSYPIKMLAEILPQFPQYRFYFLKLRFFEKYTFFSFWNRISF